MSSRHSAWLSAADVGDETVKVLLADFVVPGDRMEVLVVRDDAVTIMGQVPKCAKPRGIPIAQVLHAAASPLNLSQTVEDNTAQVKGWIVFRQGGKQAPELACVLGRERAIAGE